MASCCQCSGTPQCHLSAEFYRNQQYRGFTEFRDPGVPEVHPFNATVLCSAGVQWKYDMRVIAHIVVLRCRFRLTIVFDENRTPHRISKIT
jgi:hypothetical protein